MARLDRRLEVTWPELKTLAAKKRLGLHSFETSNASEVYLIEDGVPCFWSPVFKAGDPRHVEEYSADWENNFRAAANGPSKPRDRDGREVVQPVSASAGQWHTWHGAGDTEIIGVGVPFLVEHPQAGWCEPVVWGYRDPVWLAGGRLKYHGGLLGDQVSMTVFAPATPVTPNTEGTGNANLVFGVLVPAAGGSYDVDLSTSVPVPTQSGTGGYWDWVPPSGMRGRGSVVASDPGAGAYHLAPVRVDLTAFVNRDPLLGEGEVFYEPPHPNPPALLPHWRMETKLNNVDGAHTIKAVWRVLVTRYWTAL